MVFRISGKLKNNSNFNTRVDAADIFAAGVAGAAALKSANIAGDVVAFTVKPLVVDGKASVSIGKPRAPRKPKKGK